MQIKKNGFMQRQIIATIIMSVLLSYSSLIPALAQNKHSFIITKERIEKTKQRVAADPIMKQAWTDIRSIADGLMTRNDIRKMDYLTVAYLMTDSTKYANKLKSMLINIATQTASWGDKEMLARTPAWNSELQMAHKSFQVALAYQAIYPTLSSSERKTIAKGMFDLAVVPLIGDWISEPTRIHSLNSMGHNWWTSCSCIGGLLALSFQNEIPECKKMAESVNEALPLWFSFAGDQLQHKVKSFDDNGGMYESLNYANFGIQEALLFRLAWKDTHPGERLTEIPQLNNLVNYFIGLCYPRSEELWNVNFGDSHKNITAESSMLLLYALGDHSSDILWYLTHIQQGQNRDGYFLNTPLGFILTPDYSHAPSIPTQPHSLLLSDFGWATMRNNWKKDATMIALKSGHTWNHSHADANSFIIFHKGKDILKDAGNCSYSKPQYRNYFFQSEAHNVILFNGKGQNREQQYHGSPLRGYVTNMLDGGTTKYVLADGTGPMAEYLSRNFRHLLWIDNVLYVIDDLASHEYGEYQWLWHPGGTIRKNGFDVNVTNGNSSIIIRPIYPRPLAASDFVHDYPEDFYMETHDAPTENLDTTETYISFHLPGKTNKVKAITAIILKDSVNQRYLPNFERRDGKNWIGLRVSNGEKITDIYINQLADGRLMHSNSWIEADGWTTDSYMFAVSYKKGEQPSESKDLFVSYGSSLRRESEVYLSSLAKINLIYSGGKKEAEIQLDGQPHLIVRLRSDAPTSSIRINGKKVTATREGKLIRIESRQ